MAAAATPMRTSVSYLLLLPISRETPFLSLWLQPYGGSNLSLWELSSEPLLPPPPLQQELVRMPQPPITDVCITVAQFSRCVCP